LFLQLIKKEKQVNSRRVLYNFIVIFL